MSHYRIEYLSEGLRPGERLSLAVPDVQTALVVAAINHPHGEVELWDGERQLARLQRENGGSAGFWQIG